MEHVLGLVSVLVKRDATQYVLEGVTQVVWEVVKSFANIHALAIVQIHVVDQIQVV